MAAYAALVSLVNDLELIPIHPVHSFSFDNKQITSLSRKVEFLIDFVETYDDSHGCTRESVQVLESRIAAAAHAAHDVIESHVVDQIHAGSTLASARKLRSCFFLDLQKALDNMEFVGRKAMQFKATSGSKAKQQPTYSAPTPSEPPKNVMVGFDGTVLRLLEILTGEPSNQRLVVPVTGMGGMGKTTLARYAYDHSYVEGHFDVRLWATISKEYSAETILRQLLSKGITESNTSYNVSDLKEELHKKLWGRRYLVVLDDMWRVNAWDEVNRYLPDNGNGSRVVVTTRLSKVASRLSSSPFEMKFLGNDESWELFCRNAFGEEDCPVELEETGRKIVTRCKGLPLSIVVIGGHFRRSSREIGYWEKVSNYMNPISSLGEEEQCLEILRLSYEHLPPYLKPCFLHMGIFREDKLIQTRELFQLWIGEGFLKPNEGLSLEEVGKNYLMDLIGRNLILVRGRRWNGEVESCGMHDIVRELCLKVGEEEKFVGVFGDTTTRGISKERRIVIPEGKKVSPGMIGALQSAPPLRSLIHQDMYLFSNYELPVNFRLLRVSAHICYIRYDPFQQVNLRFLSGEVQYSVYLPIPAFWNLQTLIFENSDDQRTVMAREIWEMPQLRHLEFLGVILPDPVLVDEGSNQQDCVVLQNLHTLLGVVNLRLTEEVCRRMPNVKDLSLVYEDFSSGDYCLHNLGLFNKLKLISCKFFGVDSKWRDVGLNLTFPTSLEELCLENCHLRWEELTTMTKPLPNIGLLRLSSVHGSEWNLDEEEFKRLKILEIRGCKELTSLIADSSHFPVLKSLIFEDVPELSEIPPEIGDIPTLKHIRLRDCSSISAAVSAMNIVVEQESEGNDDLQLYVHFRDWETLEMFQNVLQEEDLTSNNLHLTYQATATGGTKRR